MKSRLVSLIVPVFNCERFLNRCLTSLSNQTYSNLEIILVNDGSTDASAEICRKNASKDSRIVCVFQQNKGVSAARNQGMSYAKGDYIMFVDADDWLTLDAVQFGVTLLEKNKADIFIGTLSWEKNGLAIAEKIFCNDEALYLEGNLDKLRKLLFVQKKAASTTQSLCGPYCKLFDRRILEGILFCEKIYYAEDTLFVYEAFLRASKIVCSDKIIYHYFVRNDSASHKAFKATIVYNYVTLIRKLDLLSSQYRKNDRGDIDIFLTRGILNCSRLLVQGKTDKQMFFILRTYWKKRCAIKKILANGCFSRRLKIEIFFIWIGFFKFIKIKNMIHSQIKRFKR